MQHSVRGLVINRAGQSRCLDASMKPWLGTEHGSSNALLDGPCRHSCV